VLRSNLSTRPFYNERVVHLLIALAGAIVLAITLRNVVRVIELSRHNTELTGRISADRSEADRLSSEAARTRRGIDPKELTLVAAAAREANSLIDQRTFSWTAFFNQIEATLPPDVMLVSVRPSIEHGQTKVSLVVLGRTTEDIDEFMEKLEATGTFEHVLPRQQEPTENGLQRQIVDAVYVPGDAEPAKAEHPAAAPLKPAQPGAQPKAGTPPAAAPKPATPGTTPPKAGRSPGAAAPPAAKSSRAVKP
jgi:Tfp pilus assembly protein PilN